VSTKLNLKTSVTGRNRQKWVENEEVTLLLKSVSTAVITLSFQNISELEVLQNIFYINHPALHKLKMSLIAHQV
jgi:hypothetical protein